MTSRDSRKEVEAVRGRPGMYIGDTDDGSGLHHMVWEVLANSVDEFLAGHCTCIDITVRAEGAITVEDDGRGMRTDEVDGRPFTELALTTLHHTPTLDGHTPHDHIGLHGVGLFPVCALSTSLELEVFRQGTHFKQLFERGRAVSRLQRLGSTQRSGTRVTFLPDPEILTVVAFDAGVIAQRVRELTFLLPSLKITLRDERHIVFEEPQGLAGWVDARLRLDPEVRTSGPLKIQDTRDEIRVEVAANWGTRWRGKVESFANINRTTGGGTHVRGLLRGLVAGLRVAEPELCRDRTESDLESRVSEGLVAIVCVRLDDLSFAGPTRERLATPRVRDIVEQTVAEPFAAYLRQHPELLRRLAAGTDP